METCYVLRVSVKVLGKAPVRGLEARPSVTIGPVNVSVGERWPFLIFLAREFTSEAEAEAFLPVIKGGLWNIAIGKNIAFTPYFERRKITWFEDPDQAARNLFAPSTEASLEPVDGLTEEEGHR